MLEFDAVEAPRTQPGRIAGGGPAWLCLRLVAAGGALAAFGNLIGESYQRAGGGFWIAGIALVAFAALLALVDWRGVVAEIARPPAKTRYGALMTRPATVRCAPPSSCSRAARG